MPLGAGNAVGLKQHGFLERNADDREVVLQTRCYFGATVGSIITRIGKATVTQNRACYGPPTTKEFSMRREQKHSDVSNLPNTLGDDLKSEEPARYFSYS